MPFSAHFALCLGLGERFSLFFPVEQGNPASSPRADSANFAGRKKGRPLPERPRFVVTPLAPQLCQRNACGFLAEPCEITTLTSAGPRKFIASSTG